MKEFTILMILLLSCTGILLGQSENGQERIQTAKIAFLSQKLELTPEEAQKFWPVYNEFNQKKKDIQIERRIARLEMEKSSFSDDDAKKIISDEFKARKNELQLEEQYFQKFQEIITPKKVVKLAHAEREFNSRIIKRMQQMQQMKEMRQMQPDRNPRRGN